jgi:hypothetical protein
MDPLGDLANFVLGRIKEGLWAQWLKFLFELAFSAIVSFLFICGSVLAATRSAAVAIGSGMVMAAIAMTTLFRREKNKLTKGMLVVLPSAEAAQEIATDLQTIQKSDQEK